MLLKSYSGCGTQDSAWMETQQRSWESWSLRS